MALPPVPHNTPFQVKDTVRIAQPWLQWLEILRQEVSRHNEVEALAHGDLTGVSADQHHAEVHTHTSGDGGGISHSDLDAVVADQHHAQSHTHNGTDSSGLINYFGSVVSETSYGLSSADGVLGTMSRSDHTHGTPVSTTTAHALASFRQIAGGVWGDAWYLAGTVIPSKALFSATLGVLYAVPFLSGRNTAFTGFAMRTSSTTVGTKFRMGIYTNTADTNLYPAALVKDSGELTVSAAETTSLFAAVSLTSDQLYWAVLLSDTTTGFGGNALAGSNNFIGDALGSLGSNRAAHISVANAYGALPSTFPSGAISPTAGSIPGIAIRFSA
jgi:hypothetical protein